MEESKNLYATVDQWFTARRFGFLLAVLIVAAFPDVVFGFRTFFFRDFGFFGYPLAHYHKECFWRGEIPLWNPLSDCGLPFLAQWNTMVLYPGTLFYLMFPLSWSLGVYCLLHQFAAGMGMYFLARRLTNSNVGASVAGVAFAFNGLTLNCLMWPNNIAALAWMPWVILWIERACEIGGKSLAVAAVGGGLQMLTGAPELIAFTWMLAGLGGLAVICDKRAPAWKVIVRLSLLVVLVIGLAAAQLLPFLDLLAHSQRNLNFADSGWSMPRSGLANFLVPAFRFVQSRYNVFFQAGQYWTSSYYCGITIIFLALFSMKRSWRDRATWLWITGLVCLLLAMGERGFLYLWVRKIVPLGFIRYPIKFVMPTIFCLCLLAAYGSAAMIKEISHGKFLTRRLGGIFTSLFLVVTAVVTAAFFLPDSSENFGRTFASAISRLIFLVAAISLLKWRMHRPASVAPVMILLLLVFFDPLTHLPRQNPTLPLFAFGTLQRDEPLGRNGAARAMLSRHADSELRLSWTTNALRDYLGYRLALFGNCNLIDQIPKVNGFYSLYLKESYQIISRLYDTNQALPAPLLDSLGVSHMTALEQLTRWEYRPTAMELVTAGQKGVGASSAVIFEKIFEKDFDPRRTVYLPVSAAEAHPADAGIADETDVKVTGKLTSRGGKFQVHSSRPCWVLIAQSYYHPWKVFVNHVSKPVIKANYAFQAVAVPAGSHEVKLVYQDQLFLIGLVISATAVLVCGAIFYFNFRSLARVGHPLSA